MDQRIREVRDASASNKYISRLGLPVLSLLSKVNDSIKLPMKALTNMNAIVNNKPLLKLLLEDNTSANTRVSLKFILSLITADYNIEPENFNICPVLMVHPGRDMWTPLKLSKLFYDRLKCNKQLILLENAGHFPIEEASVEQLKQSVVNYIAEQSF